MKIKRFPYENYPCREKGCLNKKRNGRCSLTEIRFDDNGNCLDKKEND